MRPAGELLPGEEGGASAGGSAGYLPATGGGGSAEENVAAAAAAAAVAGMAHTFMASPPEATCSTSMQLHTPMTGALGGGRVHRAGLPWALVVGVAALPRGREVLGFQPCIGAAFDVPAAPLRQMPPYRFNPTCLQLSLSPHSTSLPSLPPCQAGESTAGVLQSSYSTVSGEPSPMSRGGGDPRDPRSGAHSAHSSPLRPGMAAGLLDGADLAAVQNSLATMGLQVGSWWDVGMCCRWRRGGCAGGCAAALLVCCCLEVRLRLPLGMPGHALPALTTLRRPALPYPPQQENGHMHSPVHSASGGMLAPSLSDGATSSWRALSPDHHQQQQQQQQAQQQQQQQQSSPLGPPSAPLSPLQHAQAAAAQQAAAAASGSAGVSPIKGLAGLQGDETVVYSALSRPLPDYALTHVFSQVGPGAPGAGWGGSGFVEGPGWLRRPLSTLPHAAVEFVRVLADERVAMVKYCSPEGARLAVGSLNGTEVLGEVLHVRHSPPLPLHVRMTP